MLITKSYQKANSQAHQDDPNWGTTGHAFAPIVEQIAREVNAQSILDYGAGKQTMKKALEGKFNVFCYDPCIKEISKSPGKHDVVSCTDVLEHVEPECLDNVLDDLKRVTKKKIFLTIATNLAAKILPDGRNAHLITEKLDWWLPKLLDRFDIEMIENKGNMICAICRKK